MDNALNDRLKALEEKMDAVHRSSESIRKYFKWTFIATIVFFILPLIASLFIIPYFINTYSSLYSGLY